jgi:hypothetical protein
MTSCETYGKSPRDFTPEEVRARFLALKATMTEDQPEPDHRIQWHEVDSPMRVAQYDQIPRGSPGICGRTNPLWMRYQHRDRRQVVIAKGVFDHETGAWLVRYCAVDDGDRLRRVEPIAWARIVPDVTPEDALVIPSPPGGGI